MKKSKETTGKDAAQREGPFALELGSDSIPGDPFLGNPSLENPSLSEDSLSEDSLSECPEEVRKEIQLEMMRPEGLGGQMSLLPERLQAVEPLAVERRRIGEGIYDVTAWGAVYESFVHVVEERAFYCYWSDYVEARTCPVTRRSQAVAFF